MTLTSSRTVQPTILMAVIAMVALFVVSISTRAGAADQLDAWVTTNAETVVEATVLDAQVRTLDDGSIWTTHRLQTDDDTLTVINQGGVDDTTGRWQYLSHGAELVVGSEIVVALEQAQGYVPSDLMPADGDAWVVYGGADGVSVQSPVTTDNASVGSANLLPSSYYTGSRWGAMPVDVRINPNVNTQIRSGTSDAIIRAMDRWGAIGGSDAKFRYAGTSSTSAIGNPPFSNAVFAAPLSGQLGTTLWAGSVGLETTTSFVIVLNGGTLPFGSTWSMGAASGAYDIESVIQHELGHVLGIGHTAETYSIMYPTLFRAESKLNLSSIELEAARTLYPTSDCGFARPGAIIGTPGNDTLIGTSAADVIIGGGGDDVIVGGGGNDTLCGDEGSDTIYAGDGNDTIYGGSYADKLRGADGDDTIYGGDGNDDINGGRDNDKVSGQGGDDKLRGGTGDDTVEGGDGNDFVSGNGGSDVVRGGNGRDELRGGPRPDQLYGDADDDIVKGYGGADSLYGGAGNDQLYGGKDNEKHLDGGAGTDMCNGGVGDESLTVVTGCTTMELIP